MNNNMLLPAKRVIEGEVVENIGDIKISIKLDFDPNDFKKMIEALDQAMQSIEEAQRKGFVSAVLTGDDMSNCIDVK